MQLIFDIITDSVLLVLHVVLDIYLLHSLCPSPLLYLSFVCRIASNEPSFMSLQLKILDQRHKQKLNLKALDAVLFGAPLRKCPVMSV